MGPSAITDIASDSLDQKSLLDAKELVSKLPEYFEKVKGEFDELDRVEELRSLNGYRTQLTSLEATMRSALELARTSLVPLTNQKQSIESHISYLTQREQEIRSYIKNQEDSDVSPLPAIQQDGPAVQDGQVPAFGSVSPTLAEAERDLSSTMTELEEARAQEKEVDEVLLAHKTFIDEGAYLIRKINENLSRVYELSGLLMQAEVEEIKYTSSATYVFGILVAAVIVGFFAIAFSSNEVRTAIFAGDSGIQFVTLFSLVIAIILFGVLKILEGKELSALLGGLSGYILGRSSGALRSPKEQATNNTKPT